MSQTSLNDSYDTVVAGAGPAGVMAALHAARRGSVLLADSSQLPRDKSCGGMINEYAQEFLTDYGRVPEYAILSPRWVNFRYHDWDRGIRKPTKLRFLNVDRSGFDSWLVSLLPGNVTVADKVFRVAMVFGVANRVADVMQGRRGFQVGPGHVGKAMNGRQAIE